MTDIGASETFRDNAFYDEGYAKGYRQAKKEAKGFDVRELADRAGLKTYDTALPMQWYDDVHGVTGYWPQVYGFVWCYDEPTRYGEPYPLTDKAQMILKLYQSIVGINFNYHYLNVPVVEI